MEESILQDVIKNAERCANNLSGKYSEFQLNHPLTYGDLLILETSANALRECIDTISILRKQLKATNLTEVTTDD